MIELSYNNKKSIKEIESLIKNKMKKSIYIDEDGHNGVFLSGDNFDGMISLLDHFKDRVDLIYIDPPFNTNSNFYYNAENTSTVSISKNDVLAYSDKMTFEDYLEFMRERLVLIRMLMSDKGTLYVHIDCKVGHYIKILLDEIFGAENFINDITRVKSNPKNFKRKAYGNEKDVIYVYSKKPKKNIFNNILIPLTKDEIKEAFPKLDHHNRYYTTVPCHAPGETINGDTGKEWKGMLPPKGRHWRCNPVELDMLDKNGLIEWSSKGNPRIKKFSDEHKGKKIQDIWKNYKDPQRPIYPTEKNYDMLSMIIKQSSNEHSIIMDCFCGSASFLTAGVDNNRYVIGIDKSKIARNIIIEQRSNLKNICIIDL